MKFDFFQACEHRVGNSAHTRLEGRKRHGKTPGLGLFRNQLDNVIRNFLGNFIHRLYGAAFVRNIRIDDRRDLVEVAWIIIRSHTVVRMDNRDGLRVWHALDRINVMDAAQRFGLRGVDLQNDVFCALDIGVRRTDRSGRDQVSLLVNAYDFNDRESRYRRKNPFLPIRLLGSDVHRNNRSLPR